MKIYVVRHCATECSEKKIYCGSTDVPLSGEGRAEAARLFAFAERCGCGSVISSPLLRARETAEAVAGGVPILYDERLSERRFGAFEGKDAEGADGRECRYNFAVKYPGGESYLGLAARVYAFLDEILARYSDDLVLVTHGSVCRVIRAYFRDMTDGEFYSFSQPNGTVEEYTFHKRHEMALAPAPFSMMKDGKKRVELRLYDEKRRKIKAGDEIEFTNTADGEKLLVRVCGLEIFPDFKALYAALPLLECGYTEETLPKASYRDMEAYYPPERQAEFRVVGIRIEPIPLTKE